MPEIPLSFKIASTSQRPVCYPLPTFPVKWAASQRQYSEGTQINVSMTGSLQDLKKKKSSFIYYLETK